MRLTEHERHVIRAAILARDPKAEIFLFGSRTDDAKRGGDIDLLVLSSVIRFTEKLDILVDIKMQIGDQKIDLVVEPDLAKPFTRIAYRQGVPL